MMSLLRVSSNIELQWDKMQENIYQYLITTLSFFFAHVLQKAADRDILNHQ